MQSLEIQRRDEEETARGPALCDSPEVGWGQWIGCVLCSASPGSALRHNAVHTGESMVERQQSHLEKQTKRMLLGAEFTTTFAREFSSMTYKLAHQ